MDRRASSALHGRQDDSEKENHKDNHADDANLNGQQTIRSATFEHPSAW